MGSPMCGFFEQKNEQLIISVDELLKVGLFLSISPIAEMMYLITKTAYYTI
jgi:hypothetical protein